MAGPMGMAVIFAVKSILVAEILEGEDAKGVLLAPLSPLFSRF